MRLAALATIAVLMLALTPGNTPCMDMARKWMNVDKINGLDRPLAPGIPRPFRGKGVLFGIIDVEFDIHEPAFLDAQKKTRFIALWDQDTGNVKRSGTNYGRIKKGADLDADSTFGLIHAQGHGTGMASFAAGSDTSRPYYGVAPEAMIIGVKYNSDYVEQDVVNGLFWISDFADSLGVPCVVNLSIGIASGPHDGTSLTDQAIDAFSGPGRIVVGAIGNDGDKRSHISFQIDKGEARSTWVVSKIDSVKNPPRARSFSSVELWGETGKMISVSPMILDDRTNFYKPAGLSFTTQQQRAYIDTIPWADSSGKMVDTLYFVRQAERSSNLNRKPNCSVTLISYNPHLFLGMSVSLLNNASGVVHAWNLEKLAFKSNGMAGFFDGDSISTVNEVGGTGKSIITVGAYINKSRVKTYNDSIFDKKTDSDIGNITPFSGNGPTLDGRFKPDICAPGDVVIGAMSRRDPYNWQTSIWPDTTSTYGRYVRSTGTSVSSPLAAGVIALMLEANPKLTPDSIKAILKATAIKNTFTGELSMPDNRWGTGKINAYAALASVLGTSSSGTLVNHDGLGRAQVKVLSFSGRHYLSIEELPKDKNGPVKIALFDCAGHRLLNDEYHRGRMLVPQSIGKGIYIAKILIGDKTVGRRVMLF
jgi:minor extracellular serine protease Vpr